MSFGNVGMGLNTSLLYTPRSEEAGRMKEQIIADARAEGITVTELLVRRKQQGQTQLSANQGPAAKSNAAGYYASDGSSGFDDGASTAETLVAGRENAAPQGQSLAPPPAEQERKKGLRQRFNERVKEYREDKDPNKTWGNRIANGINGAVPPAL